MGLMFDVNWAMELSDAPLSGNSVSWSVDEGFVVRDHTMQQ